MRYLALLLFLPTFAIFVWLYLGFPRDLPRSPARRRFDATAVALAAGLAVLALGLAFDHDYGRVGPIWKQIAATLAAYHVFPVVLILAWFRRRARFGPERRVRL
jgi:hypothetical protein